MSVALTYFDSVYFYEDDDKLSFPSFVFAEPVMEEIYIIDSKGRIVIYTSDLYPLYSFGKNIGIQSPQGLTVDAEGNLYVTQAETQDIPRPRISVFNACMKWVRDIYIEGFEGADSFIPYRLTLDKKGHIYVAGTYFPGVVVLDDKGKFTDMISPEEEGRKVKVNNVAMDKAGKIYLVSEEAGKVYVYNENKKLLFKFGEKGGSTGKLSRPRAVGIDNRNGRLYVVDYMRHTISAYDGEGAYLFEFGGMGWSEGWFQYPNDIFIDKDGKIFVADMFNNRVQVFNAW
ncbi:MAG: SMP-30/gluconolactonase/LRE family protein [Nitrospirae bacterium]|nr:SMP-30/gluconolactonase/LRE family protein [Nitrospirota bacterium]